MNIACVWVYWVTIKRKRGKLNVGMDDLGIRVTAKFPGTSYPGSFCQQNEGRCQCVCVCVCVCLQNLGLTLGQEYEHDHKNGESERDHEHERE